MPLEHPNTNDEVPLGLMVVTRAAAFMPSNMAKRPFSSLAIFAAAFMSIFWAIPEPIPVKPMPNRASFSVVRDQTPLK